MPQTIRFSDTDTKCRVLNCFDLAHRLGFWTQRAQWLSGFNGSTFGKNLKKQKKLKWQKPSRQKTHYAEKSSSGKSASDVMRWKMGGRGMREEIHSFVSLAIYAWLLIAAPTWAMQYTHNNLENAIHAAAVKSRSRFSLYSLGFIFILPYNCVFHLLLAFTDWSCAQKENLIRCLTGMYIYNMWNKVSCPDVLI